MGDLYPNPNLNNRIFLAKQQNRAPFVSDALYGDDLLNTQGSNFRTPIIIGKRDGIPQDQPIDYFLQRNFQGNPYVRGMHPYTSNMMVDIAPSVYNTNPMAGRGGYEKNLASFNGTRPLATTLDEPQEIAQRLYEDEFKLSPNNPLSMQFTLNHAGVEKRARGEMYDAFRLGLEKNNEDKEPDYDTVLQSKRQKGYNASGFLPKGEYEKSIANYFKSQEPLNSGTFVENIKAIKTHVTPGPQAAVVPAAGPTSAVAAGAVNFLQPPSGSGGGGGGGGAGPGGGSGSSGGGGNNITIVRTRRAVENNRNAGTDLNTAMNSASTIVFTRPPSSTQSASLIPRRSPPSIVTPTVPFSSPPATLTSSAPLDQPSVVNIEPGRTTTPRKSRFSEFSPSHSATRPTTPMPSRPPSGRAIAPGLAGLVASLDALETEYQNRGRGVGALEEEALRYDALATQSRSRSSSYASPQAQIRQAGLLAPARTNQRLRDALALGVPPAEAGRMTGEQVVRVRESRIKNRSQQWTQL